MARKKRKKQGNQEKVKQGVGGRGALLPNALYKGTPRGPRRPTKKQQYKANAAAQRDTSAAIEKGKKMAMIEAYAKEHKISVTQAMIHFM